MDFINVIIDSYLRMNFGASLVHVLAPTGCIHHPRHTPHAMMKRAPNPSRKKKTKVQFEYTKKYTFDRETTKKVDHFIILALQHFLDEFINNK